MDGITLKTSQMMSDIAGAGISRELAGDRIIKIPQSSGISNSSFADTLQEAIGKVNQLHQESDKAIQTLATGRSDNIADVMIAAEKADIALKVMVQVRNKIIDAYQEMMRMQV
jgi:flagellar hook-basal body complex protein FliE